MIAWRGRTLFLRCVYRVVNQALTHLIALILPMRTLNAVVQSFRERFPLWETAVSFGHGHTERRAPAVLFLFLSYFRRGRRQTGFA